MQNVLPKSPHLQYRPDIDGLRAIAVLSVVIFHAFPSILPGGFIGVDIFFVISGFLITSIILKELNSNHFSYIDFYARRIRRIFPTLTLVLVSCYLIGWSTLFAIEYEPLGKHIAAGAGFVSNFILWNESGYFDTASDLKPLLHLWSLAVEEQFYIAWPIILWLTNKWKRSYLGVICLIFLFSFFLNIFQTFHNPIAAFYSPINRFWELLIGAILAYANTYISSPVQKKGALKNVTSIAGIFLILSSNFFIGKNSSFPGWLALAPTIGAALLILPSRNAWINEKILSSRPLVWIGLISYPLYLWHWPLLSFGKLLYSENLSVSFTMGLVLISVVLAFISYKYLELPIRGLGIRGASLLILLMLAIGCAGYSVWQRHGLEFRHYKALKGYGDKAPHSDQKCLELFSSWKPDFCNFFSKSGHPKTIIVGDSIAHNLYPGMLARFQEGSDGIAMTGWPGRQPWIKLEGEASYAPILSEQMNILIKDLASNDSILQIALSMNQPKEITPELEAQIRRTINLLKNNNKHVIYVYSPPPLSFSPITCFGMPPLRPALIPSCTQLVSEIPPEFFKTKGQLNSIFLSLKIPTYDPFEYICKNGVCEIKQGSILLYRTNRYLSTQGSEIILRNFPVRW